MTHSLTPMIFDELMHVLISFATYVQVDLYGRQTNTQSVVIISQDAWLHLYGHGINM